IFGYAVFNNLAGATFEAQTDATIDGNGDSASAFNNAGTFLKSAGTGTTTISGPTFNNSGTVEVQVGTLKITAPFTQFDGSSSTLAGGTYLVTSTLSFAGANIQTNAATIVLDGPSSQIINSSNSADGLAHFATNAPGGSFTIQGGRDITTGGDFTNAG